MRSGFALLTAVLLAVFTAAAKTPKTRVEILVTSMEGVPVEHAEVTVKTVNGKKSHIYWKLYTHEEGIVRTPADVEIPQGTVLIQVIATGYQTFGQTFEVNELEKTIEVKLNSPQEQYSAH